MKKSFIITVDTEPDGQWDIKAKSTTENAKYIIRFQNLCEKYGFKPVYLVDYIMASDEYFVNMIKERVENNKCEIGMHLHAWDTPPIVENDKIINARPFITEYSTDIMEQKVAMITEKLKAVFGKKIITHRAGRWAINEEYINILAKYGYKVDCSITPHIDWSKTKGNLENFFGPNYSEYSDKPFIIEKANILETPMTIKSIKGIATLKNLDKNNLKKILKRLILGEKLWFRPAMTSIKDLKYLCELSKEDLYLMFMLHSSELMPGGSPYFKDEIEIENLYKTLEEIFEFLANSYEGVTLEEYYFRFTKKIQEKNNGI